MARVKMAVARERKARVLRLLYELGADSRDVAISLNGIAAVTGLSFDQVHGVMKSLKADGLLQAFPRKLANGGTDSNAYRLTAAGYAKAQAAKEPRAVCPCEATRKEQACG